MSSASGKFESGLFPWVPALLDLLDSGEALERLRLGKFDGAGLFEQSWIQGARILACALDYRADTKGFYQPVYVFTILPLGQDPGGYCLEAGEFILPALK